MVILVADADGDRSRDVLQWLEAEGHRTRLVRDGRSAIAQFDRITPDILILGSCLPLLGVEEVCRRIRCLSELPMIVLGCDHGGGAGGEPSVDVLEAGADDYIKAPIRELEFLARLHVAARHIRRSPPSRVIRIGDIRLYPREYRATALDAELRLRPQEFRLLTMLAGTCGSIVSYERLLELAWNRGRGTGSVRIHVSSLRRKLRGSNVRIENIHGAGYRLMVAPTAL